jgi:hypothetical protein
MSRSYHVLGYKADLRRKIAVHIRRPFSKPSHAGITYEQRCYGRDLLGRALVMSEFSDLFAHPLGLTVSSKMWFLPFLGRRTKKGVSGVELN